MLRATKQIEKILKKKGQKKSIKKKGNKNKGEKRYHLLQLSLLSLADEKWHAAALGPKPLRLPRGQKRSQSPVSRTAT